MGDAYGDIPRGVFVVRGENVVLLGEIEERDQVKVNRVLSDDYCTVSRY